MFRTFFAYGCPADTTLLLSWTVATLVSLKSTRVLRARPAKAKLLTPG